MLYIQPLLKICYSHGLSSWQSLSRAVSPPVIVSKALLTRAESCKSFIDNIIQGVKVVPTRLRLFGFRLQNHIDFSKPNFLTFLTASNCN